MYVGSLQMSIQGRPTLIQVCGLETDPMQLVDELSMIYTTCLMCYAVFSYSKTRQFAIILATGLVSLAVFITLYYHYLQNPVFHQTVYALLTVVMLARSTYVMEFSLRPSLKMSEEQYKRQRKRSMTADEKVISRFQDRRDARILKLMWTMIVCGLFTFLSGFALWSLDNEYCSTIRRWRRQVGLPWGILLEGHGWWYDSATLHMEGSDTDSGTTRHIMTGTGAYFYIIWGIWLRHCLNGRQEEYDLSWPRLLSLPEIVRTKNQTTNRSRQVPKKTL